jgi:hypothetical protein
LIGSVRTIEAIAQWLSSDSMHDEIFNDDDDEFSSSTWSFW